MTDAKPWEELVELVPELRPERVVAWAHSHDGPKGLGFLLDPSARPCPIIHDMQDVCESLIRDRAVEWLASEHRVYIVDLGCDCHQAMEVCPDGDKPIIEVVPGVFDSDRDTALRLAVAAVAGKGE